MAKAYGVDVRRDLTLERHVQCEPGGTVSNLKLGSSKVEPRLDICARDAQHRPAGELARDRAMQMAADDQPHLTVACDQLAERGTAPASAPGIVLPRATSCSGPSATE
jgi:hypothetical protein